MTILDISLQGEGTCKVQHNETPSEVFTSKPKEYGGRGNEFSSTDLLAAALGTCIGSSLEKVLIRNRIDLDKVKLQVFKDLSSKPKTISLLKVVIHLAVEIDEKTEKILLKTAGTCLVSRSLAVKPIVDLSYDWPSN